MTILPPEFEHKDARRTLTQLMSGEFKQLNVYHANQGAKLGNHFHKDTTEWFYVVQGTLEYNGLMTLSDGTLFKVTPPESHTLECLTPCTIITAVNRPYSQENPDIYA